MVGLFRTLFLLVTVCSYASYCYANENGLDEDIDNMLSGMSKEDDVAGREGAPFGNELDPYSGGDPYGEMEGGSTGAAAAGLTELHSIAAIEAFIKVFHFSYCVDMFKILP